MQKSKYALVSFFVSLFYLIISLTWILFQPAYYYFDVLIPLLKSMPVGFFYEPGLGFWIYKSIPAVSIFLGIYGLVQIKTKKVEGKKYAIIGIILSLIIFLYYMRPLGFLM